MTKLTLICSVPALALLAACAANPPAPQATAARIPAQQGASAGNAEVRNVIFMMADGAGTAYWTAARAAAGKLSVEDMPVAALVDTRSSNSRVTDSAAGATVYAAGVRTYNGAIGVAAECREMVRQDSMTFMRDPGSCAPVELVTEVMARDGAAVGLVATSSVTHATPASFGAHVPFRSMQAEIAQQLAEGPFEVILGGGRGFFSGSLRPDSTDLLARLCVEGTCLSTPAELAAYTPDDRRLVGLFSEDGMEVARDRKPTLQEMTRVALSRLSRDSDGFFLLVEGSQPDWRGHDNQPLSRVADEMVDFDQAIGEALEFARSNEGTLVVVTADHETGGLALHASGDSLVAHYTTGSHTGAMVPLFAFGPGAERFGGMLDNYRVGEILMEIVKNR